MYIQVKLLPLADICNDSSYQDTVTNCHQDRLSVKCTNHAAQSLVLKKRQKRQRVCFVLDTLVMYMAYILIMNTV